MEGISQASCPRKNDMQIVEQAMGNVLRDAGMQEAGDDLPEAVPSSQLVELRLAL